MNKKRIMKIVRRLLRIPEHIFWIFPIKGNRIVFQSFKGNAYSDSCKAIIEYLHTGFPGKYDMYWVADDNFCKSLPNYLELHCIKRYTLKYFYYCLTAKVLICNINQGCSLALRNTQQFVNLWHGMPYKTLGLDEKEAKHGVNYNACTLFLSPCKFFTDQVIRYAFQYTGEVLECGLPRNDILFQSNLSTLKAMIYNQYCLDNKIKTVLFAPTFRRDFEYVDTKLDFARVTKALRKRFDGEWVLLFRAHPMLVRKDEELKGAINVTFYPDIMELLAVCDILITDYSSSMWDFALTGKPVFLYAPDLQDYADDRGFYADMENLPFPLGHDNAEVQLNIEKFEDNSYQENLKLYFQKMGSFEHGHACEALGKEIEKWCKGVKK